MTTLCDACQTNEAAYHITLQAAIYGPKTEKLKTIHFWLCEACEQASRQALCKDELQRYRVAFRFVDNPSFMSPYSRWKKKTAAARPTV